MSQPILHIDPRDALFKGLPDHDDEVREAVLRFGIWIDPKIYRYRPHLVPFAVRDARSRSKANPDGLETWGDTRLTVLGTEGFLEVRKNVDLAGREGGDHLFWADGGETHYVDCSDTPLSFGERLLDDVAQRTQTAMSQEHCFLACELALFAQELAEKTGPWQGRRS